MNQNDWTKELQKLLMSRTGLTLQDINDELVQTSYEKGETPEELVTFIMDKYELNDISGV